MGSSSECYNLTWNEFQSSVANSFVTLRNEEDFLDCTVAIDEDHQLQAHKVILSATSPYFHSMLKRNPSQHPVLVMPPHVRFSDLVAVIDFIYQGEVKVPIAEFTDFMSLAELLKIRGLTEDSKNKPNLKAQAKLPPGTQMVRRRSGPSGPPPSSAPPQQVAKRPRMMPGPQAIMNPPKFGQSLVPPVRPPPNPEEGVDDEDVHEVDEDSSDMYGEFDESFEGQDFGMEPPPPPQPAVAPVQGPSQQPPSASGLQLTGLLCPKCRIMCHGVEALKDHMAKNHGMGSGDQQSQQQEESKSHICHICDKGFKTAKYVQAHIKRVHKVGASPGGEHPEESSDGMGMDPQIPGMVSPGGKKKGRPKKSDQHLHQQQPQQPQPHHQQQMQHPQQPQPGMSRPIGQVSPAPRPPMGDGKEGQESIPRPPVSQLDRASPMVPRQRHPGMMSPTGLKKPMAPQGILGPGMRPRGPAPPQQFQPQQFQQQQPVDIKRLGMKLGGAISITSSDQGQGATMAAASAPRRPLGAPSTSGRAHVSSPKSDPLATPRPPVSSTQRPAQDAPVVKEEPMDDMYEEGEDMGEEFGEEEEENFPDEDEEDEEEDLEYAEGMYGGEAPYDDDIDQDGGAYQQ